MSIYYVSGGPSAASYSYQVHYPTCYCVSHPTYSVVYQDNGKAQREVDLANAMLQWLSFVVGWTGTSRRPCRWSCYSGTEGGRILSGKTGCRSSSRRSGCWGIQCEPRLTLILLCHICVTFFFQGTVRTLTRIAEHRTWSLFIPSHNKSWTGSVKSH